VNEAGTASAADSLMPAVLAKIDALRNLTTSVRGKDYTFDIKPETGVKTMDLIFEPAPTGKI